MKPCIQPSGHLHNQRYHARTHTALIILLRSAKLTTDNQVRFSGGEISNSVTSNQELNMCLIHMHAYYY